MSVAKSRFPVTVFVGLVLSGLLMASCGHDAMIIIDNNTGGSPGAVDKTNSQDIFSAYSQSNMVSSGKHSGVLVTNPLSVQGNKSAEVNSEDPFLVLGMDRVDFLFDK